MSEQLNQYLSNRLHLQQDEVLQSFVSQINKEFNNVVKGIIFYGSCMRSREYQDAMLDFYVIVKDYSCAYKNYWFRMSNYLLGPNVFYMQTEVDGKIYRAKYAVMSEEAMSKGVEKSFHSYFWARFTQPLSYIYAREDNFPAWLTNIQCMAANSFFNEVNPQFQDAPLSEDFWVKGLQLTYQAELRAESKMRAKHIYQNNLEYYEGLFACLLSEDPRSLNNSFNSFKWALRKYYGKLLSILRLMKATTTFVGGVDYIAWKIARHTGEEISVTDKMRKYPWIYCWPVVFKLFKQGKIH